MTRVLMAGLLVSAISLPHVELSAVDSSDGQSVATGNATVAGRVTAADSGQPLRGALVRALIPNGAQVAAVRTNRDGIYELNGLSAGSYAIRATRSSFVSLMFGQRAENDPETRIQLVAGRRVERVDLRLSRAAAIAGTVVDEFGDPVTGARVRALRARFIRGRRELSPAGFVPVTDDLGQFRVYGLTPGEYALSASVRSTAENLRESEPGYAVTFFPGTASTAEIQWMRVVAGETVTNITIPLVPSRVFELSGVVLDRSGQPSSGGVVNVLDRAINAPIGAGQVGRDGTFSVADLAPGDYLLSSNNFGSTGDLPQVARLPVRVRTGDVSGLRLMPLGTRGIHGRLLVADARSAPRAVSGVTFDLVRLSDDGLDAHRPNAIVSRQMTFDVLTFVGQVQLKPRGLPENWTVKSVRVGDLDVTDTGIEITASSTPLEVTVEVTDRFPKLSGRVTDAAGDVLSSYSVIVFSRDPSKWSFHSRYIHHGLPTANSEFQVGPLPPGDYYAVAVSRLTDDRWADSDYLQTLRQDAINLTVRENEPRDVSLRMTK